MHEGVVSSPLGFCLLIRSIHEQSPLIVNWKEHRGHNPADGPRLPREMSDLGRLLAAYAERMVLTAYDAVDAINDLKGEADPYQSARGSSRYPW